MNQNPSYKSYQVKVSFVNGKVICKRNELEIPDNTIATITWCREPNSDFLFLQFEWTRKNGFLSQDPITHDHCVIAAVNNTKRHTNESWPYLLKIQVGDRVYQTSTKPGITADDGQPTIHTR